MRPFCAFHLAPLFCTLSQSFSSQLAGTVLVLLRGEQISAIHSSLVFSRRPLVFFGFAQPPHPRAPRGAPRRPEAFPRGSRRVPGRRSTIPHGGCRAKRHSDRRQSAPCGEARTKIPFKKDFRPASGYRPASVVGCPFRSHGNTAVATAAFVQRECFSPLRRP